MASHTLRNSKGAMHHHRIPNPQLLHQVASSAIHTFVLVSCSASVSLSESATTAGWSKPDEVPDPSWQERLHCSPLRKMRICSCTYQ